YERHIDARCGGPDHCESCPAVLAADVEEPVRAGQRSKPVARRRERASGTMSMTAEARGTVKAGAVSVLAAAAVPMPEFAERFGAFLAAENVIDRAVLERARRAARTTGERFDQVLTKLGLVSEADI